MLECRGTYVLVKLYMCTHACEGKSTHSGVVSETAFLTDLELAEEARLAGH